MQGEYAYFRLARSARGGGSTETKKQNNRIRRRGEQESDRLKLYDKPKNLYQVYFVPAPDEFFTLDIIVHNLLSKIACLGVTKILLS